MKSDEENIILLGKKFKLPVFDKQEINVEDFTRVNVRNVENDMELLPGQLSIYGILVAKALKRTKSAETNYKIWNSMKSNELRSNYDKKGIKVTENKLVNDIRADPQYKILKKILYKAEEDYEIIKSVYWAIQKKSEVLIELSRQRSNLKKLDNMRTDKY